MDDARALLISLKGESGDGWLITPARGINRPVLILKKNNINYHAKETTSISR